MKYKVLLVILNGKEYGGSEKHVVDIINNIDNKKYDVYLIMSEGNPMDENINSQNVKEIFCVNRNNLFCLKKMNKIIKQVDPDIMHAHAARGIFYSRLLYKKYKEKMKLICTAHGWILEYLKFNKLLQKMFSINKNLDNKTLTVSKFSMNEMIEKGYDSKKIEYIYNGINVEEYNLKAKIKSEVKNISYIGRFTNQKGITYMMKAIKMLKESKFVFNIYGKGELQEYIEKYIEENKLFNVKMHNFIPANKVREVLYNTDVLLLPSIDEGFPYILVEAVACGVPCIATNVGGVSEIINNDVGILIDSKDSKQICEAIKKIDRKDISKISKACIEKSKKFSIDNMINEIQKNYEEVLNG